MSELVLVEVRDQSAILTINRADKRNALSRALISAIHEAVDRVGDDPKVRAVILTGAGSVFCAGMDLEELQGSLDANASADVPAANLEDGASGDGASKDSRADTEPPGPLSPTYVDYDINQNWRLTGRYTLDLD